MATTATAMEGETIDQICWRVLGRTSAVTEQVLLLNPGIATLGPNLPAGTPVILPDIAKAKPAVRETIQLWD